MKNNLFILIFTVLTVPVFAQSPKDIPNASAFNQAELVLENHKDRIVELEKSNAKLVIMINVLIDQIVELEKRVKKLESPKEAEPKFRRD